MTDFFLADSDAPHEEVLDELALLGQQVDHQQRVLTGVDEVGRAGGLEDRGLGVAEAGEARRGKGGGDLVETGEAGGVLAQPCAAAQVGDRVRPGVVRRKDESRGAEGQAATVRRSWHDVIAGLFPVEPPSGRMRRARAMAPRY